MSEPKRVPDHSDLPDAENGGAAERRERSGGPRRRKLPLIRKPLPIERLGSIADTGLPKGHDLETLPRPEPVPLQPGTARDDEAASTGSRRPAANRSTAGRSGRGAGTSTAHADDGKPPLTRARGAGNRDDRPVPQATPAAASSVDAGRRPVHGSKRPAARRPADDDRLQTRRPSQRVAGSESVTRGGAAQADRGRYGATRQSRVDDAFDGPIDDDWRDGVGPTRAPGASRKGTRVALFLLAIALIGSGGWLVYDRGIGGLEDVVRQAMPDGWLGNGGAPDDGIDRVDERLADAGIEAEREVRSTRADSEAAEAAPRNPPLAVRFRERLATLEQQVADGELGRARESLASMDRTLYGYGRPEFEALAARIDALAEADGNAESQSAAERRAAARQAAIERQADRDRQAGASDTEAVADAETTEVADDPGAEPSVAGDDPSPSAAESAGTDPEAATVEAAEADAEEAVGEAERAAAERRGEAQRQAERERQVQEDAAATARQVERERQAAADREAAESAGSANGEVVAAIRNVPIGDEDLRTVYARFLELATAIEARDITRVIDLTQPSGARIQQLLQVFENTQAVYTRIGSMATRQAEGVIVGNLVIDRLVRTDGTIAQAPDDLASIRLTSSRTAGGWSAIEW